MEISVPVYKFSCRTQVHAPHGVTLWNLEWYNIRARMNKVHSISMQNHFGSKTQGLQSLIMLNYFEAVKKFPMIQVKFSHAGHH